MNWMTSKCKWMGGSDRGGETVRKGWRVGVQGEQLEGWRVGSREEVASVECGERGLGGHVVVEGSHIEVEGGQVGRTRGGRVWWPGGKWG